MAMDNFLEVVVTKRNRGAQTILYIIANIMMVVLAIMAFAMLNIFIIPMITGALGEVSSVEIILTAVEFLLTAGLAVLLFLRRDRIRTDYEYTITNEQMDFAQVFNNKKRKNLGTMNIKNVSAMGLVASGSFNRYLTQKDVKRSNWFINRDAQLFYFYFTRDNVKRMIIIEANDSMIAHIKRYAAQGAFQVN